MKAFIIVGHTGRGKSAFSKKLIEQLKRSHPALIYDVNNEYGVGHLPDWDEFLELAADEKQTRQRLILFEEATIFFSSAKSKLMTSILVRKRHTKNIPVLLFHSLADVPPYILRFVDFLILFKTNDNPGAIYDKFKYNDQLIGAYERVKASKTGTCECKQKHPPGFHYSEIIKL